MTGYHPPRHVVRSTDQIDLNDPYQRCWCLRQVMTHGRAEDIRALGLQEISRELENLNLPSEVYSFWKAFQIARHVKEQ